MIAITHPLKEMINSQYSLLSSMLDIYPGLMNEWVRKQEEEVRQLADSEANKDTDVYLSILNSEMARIAPCYDEEQLFNQAMLIMVYSYYESSLLRLAKEINEEEARPSVIAKHFGKDLDDEMLKISNYLLNSIEPLRNQLCHNNQGTLFVKKDKRKEKQIEDFNILVKKKFITLNEGRIVAIDGTFVRNILDGVHKLLLSLAKICGFKTKWYVYKDGKMVMYENYEEAQRVSDTL